MSATPEFWGAFFGAVAGVVIMCVVINFVNGLFADDDD